MKVGSLIQYHHQDGDDVLGVVVEDMGYFEEYQKDAVKVHWLDNSECTIERVSDLLDPDEKSCYEVICESR